MFTKINFSFDPHIPISIGQIINYFGSTDPKHDLENFKGVYYRQILTGHETFLNLVPEHTWKNWSVTYMTITDMAPPHIDNKITSNINFYITTDNCITKFWTPKAEPLSTYQLSTQTNGRLYDTAQLEMVSNFIAQDGDVYLLDITKIHSVEAINKQTFNRTAISMHSYYTYSQVEKLLKETGYGAT